MKTVIAVDPPVNQAPSDLDPARDLPRGFYDFLTPLHRAFTPRQQELAASRRRVLEGAHGGKLPDYLGPSEATTGSWKVSLPGWCQDQRNQMTGPGDDGELVVKMLNSGAPGVMLDLEDSVANAWPNIVQAIENIIAALRGELTYQDKKRNREVGINESKTVILTRPRGLHLEQAGVIKGERMAAALFDVAIVAYQVDPSRLKHPLSIYIAKSESADEALWWRDLFHAVSAARGWPTDYIKCMALVESHPLAYQMEEFAYNLREHMMGLNLGRWDYMASLIDFTLHDPAWVLPDRNTIPHDVAFFQNLREVMPEVCHKRGMLAIGGMTALYPSREDVELNARALKVLDGYMEDLATDRIYRYMIAQRILHKVSVPDADGRAVTHSPEVVSRLFDEELERLARDWPKAEAGSKETMQQARDLSEGMVLGILEAQGLARGARSE